ncbi:MAG: arylsulfatase, partial [Prevotella sp.]|nr:arylsulfatase [Prevotella sp.]
MTTLFAVQLMMYMKGSPVAAMMDFDGWLFFVTSCVSHAACLALLPFLVLFTPFGLFGRYRTGGALMAVGVSLLSVLIFLNMQ